MVGKPVPWNPFRSSLPNQIPPAVSQSTFSAVLVGALSGSVAAALVTLVLSPSGGSRSLEGQLQGAPVQAAESGTALEALARLEDENQALELRIATLEARPQVSNLRAPVEESSDRGAALRGEGGSRESEAARLITEAGSISQAYYEDFRMAADLYDAEKAAARDERRRVERQERNEARVLRLAETLGLDDYQTDRVRGILGSQDEQRSTMFEQMRADGDLGLSREEMRASMSKIEDEANAAMQAVLTPIQYEQYQSSTRGASNRGGGATRGGGGGGNRGGGGTRGG